MERPEGTIHDAHQGLPEFPYFLPRAGISLLFIFFLKSVTPGGTQDDIEAVIQFLTCPPPGGLFKRSNLWATYAEASAEPRTPTTKLHGTT